jgi:hypothetical protein
MIERKPWKRKIWRTSDYRKRSYSQSRANGIDVDSYSAAAAASALRRLLMALRDGEARELPNPISTTDGPPFGRFRRSPEGARASRRPAIRARAVRPPSPPLTGSAR